MKFKKLGLISVILLFVVYCFSNPMIRDGIGRIFQGPITITGTNSQINSTTGQPLVLQGNGTEALYAYRNGIGNTSTPIGFELYNNTPTTVDSQYQDSPAIIFNSHTWDDGVDIVTKWALWGESKPLGDRSDLVFAYKNGSGNWNRHQFELSENGASTTRDDQSETRVYGFGVANSRSATSSTDCYSPVYSLRGSGYSTASGTQWESCDIFVAPEKGAVKAIGVLKFSYGANAMNATEANELLRLQWDGALGMILNYNAIASYVFDYSKATTVKPLIFTQATEPDIANDSTAYWKDSDDSKVYEIIDVGGTQLKNEYT